MATQNFRVKNGLEVGIGATILVANSDGNVGIGTDDPFSTNGTNLEVAHHTSSGASRLLLRNTDQSGLRYYIQSQNDGALTFGDISNGERLRITGIGSVGIGSEIPQNKLDVAGDVKILDNSPRLFFYDANANGASSATGGFEVFDKDGNKNVFVGAFAPDADNLIFGVTGSEKARITSGGDMGLGTLSPTARLDVRRDDTDGKIAEFHQSTGYGIQIRSSESIATIRAEYNQALVFETGTTATERLRITTGGDVLIADITNSVWNDTSGGGINLKANGQIVAKKEATSTADPLVWLNDTGQTTNKFIVFAQDGTEKSYLGLTGTSLSLGVNGGDRLLVTDAGKIGVGENTPASQVDIKGNVSSTTQFSGFDGLRIHNANGAAFGVTSDMYFTAGTATANRGAAIGVEYESGAGGNDLYFATNPGAVTSNNTLVERLRIRSNGRIGIGTDNPDQTVEINGNVKFTKGTSTEGSQMLVLPLEDITLASNASAAIPVGSRFTGIIIVAGYTNDTPGGVWAVASASSYSLDAVTNIILNNHPASNISNLTITSPSHGGTHQFQLNQTGSVTKTYKVFAMGVYG